MNYTGVIRPRRGYAADVSDRGRRTRSPTGAATPPSPARPPSFNNDELPDTLVLMHSGDPSAAAGRWDDLHALLRHIDGEIEWLYKQRAASAIRSRFAYPMIRLHHAGPMNVTALAESLGRSQSALSQTLSTMIKDGLVHTTPGEDARTRVVQLSERGRELIPMLEAEWRATEAMVAELDDELSCPLSAIVAELRELVERRPIRERLDAWMQYHENRSGRQDPLQ